MSVLLILKQAARQHRQCPWGPCAWGITACSHAASHPAQLACQLSTSSAPCSQHQDKTGVSSSEGGRLGSKLPGGVPASAAAGLGLQAKLNQQLEGMRIQLPGSPFAAGRRGPAVPRQILYKGAGMLMIRFLVRAKVFQLLGVFTAVVLIMTAVTSPTELKTFDLAAGVGVLAGCVITSYCLWFYSSRYVGELSLLLPDRRVARFSVLDFWGNRQDFDVPIHLIQPPFKARSMAEVKALTSRALMPINVTGDKQYYISVPHGHLLQKEVLQKICYGTWLSELDAAGGQANSGERAGSQPAAAVVQRAEALDAAEKS